MDDRWLDQSNLRFDLRVVNQEINKDVSRQIIIVTDLRLILQFRGCSNGVI